MTQQAHVGPVSDPSLDELRDAVSSLAVELSRHLTRLAALPEGPTSFVRLAELNEPVRRAVSRWDRAVFARTGTYPVAVDDGWAEDLDD